jgi:ubiquinone/menaquinone biosynthesis C-methylase UbiE
MKNNYFNYLNTRSFFGSLYRKYYLYPKIFNNLEGNILDVGCGVGDFLNFKNNVIGVDINEDCVNYCLKKGYNAYLMNIDKLPFPDNSFNTIVLDNVLEHIEDPANILKEIKRVLIPNGLLLIGVPCEKGFKYDADHKKFYDINRLILLLNGNFSLKKYFYTPFFLYPLRKHIRQVALYSIFKANL